MPLGINAPLLKHYRKLARNTWELQRMPDDYPVVDIWTLIPNDIPYPYDVQPIGTTSNLPYLDRTDNPTESVKQNPGYKLVFKNVPIVYEPVKYNNEFGVVISDVTMYFIFLGDVSDKYNYKNFEKGMAATFNKDALIVLYHGPRNDCGALANELCPGAIYHIDTMMHDMGSDLSKVTATLVKADNADKFFGVIA